MARRSCVRKDTHDIGKRLACVVRATPPTALLARAAAFLRQRREFIKECAVVLVRDVPKCEYAHLQQCKTALIRLEKDMCCSSKVHCFLEVSTHSSTHPTRSLSICPPQWITSQ
jgi:hypothetical protein